MPNKSTESAESTESAGPAGPADPGDASAYARDRAAGAPAQPVSEIRAFNRFYTNLIGALDYSRHLYVPYTLTEARVLYELAHSPRTDAADLRNELSLDAGYLSRLLAKFEKDRLVERAPSQRDPRRQRITLTGHGRTTAELLDERSRESVGALLATVPVRDRPRLTTAMRTIHDILTKEPRERRRPSHRNDVLLRAPGPGDLGWIVQRNATVYAAEYGWNEEYEALVARIVADFAQHHAPGRERIWIAEVDDRPVGCVMCVQDDHGTHHDEGTPGLHDDVPARAEAVSAPAPDSPGTARLRLLLVEPDARGLGVGDLLVRACIDFARNAGYEDMVLWTNDILSAARRIYQRHGFTLTAERPHHSFGADLVGQDWHLRLREPTGDRGPATGRRADVARLTEEPRRIGSAP